MIFMPYDKVWINENNVMFPGVVIGQEEENIIVYKFDQVIWRRVTVSLETLKKRDRDFSDFMFKVRENFMNVPIKFALP